MKRKTLSLLSAAIVLSTLITFGGCNASQQNVVVVGTTTGTTTGATALSNDETTEVTTVPSESTEPTSVTASDSTTVPEETEASAAAASETTTKAPEATAAPSTTKAPVVTTAPPATTKAPVTTTKAPVTTTKAPVTTTKAPVTTTKAPTTTTTAATTAPENKKTIADAVTQQSMSNEMRQEMLDLVNQARANAGVGALSLDSTANTLAQLRAEEIAVKYNSDHTRPDGTRFSTIYDEYSVTYRYIGENIGYAINTGSTVKEFFDAWMNSPAHKENILDPDFKFVGFGRYAYTSASGDQYYYWTQEFAKYTD